VKPQVHIPTERLLNCASLCPAGVAIFDYTPLHAKTGIASRMLKPHLGIVDPLNTATAPQPVAGEIF
jgi:hydroxyacid-oxoacid transhydrogenase